MIIKIKRIIAFIVGSIILLVSIILSTYMMRGYTRLFGFYDLDKDSVDVVFVGTSVTFSSFMPMEAWNEYGIVGYDYCTNVQFENSIRYSLRDVERTQSPKVIMVDIAPFMYEHYAGNESWDEENHELFIKYNLDSRKYTFDRFALVNEINTDAHGSFSDYWYYYFDISRYHTKMFTLGHIDNAEKDICRGYEHLKHNVGEVFDIKDAITDDGHITKLSDREQYYLDKLLETAEDIDSEVVFYCAPVYVKEVDQYGKKNYLKAYIEEHGFTFADFSGDVEKIGLDYTTDLWSCNHFDALGAEKVTRLLSEYLIDNYDIPDRRNDENFAYMYDDYKEWEIVKNEYVEADKEN